MWICYSSLCSINTLSFGMEGSASHAAMLCHYPLGFSFYHFNFVFVSETMSKARQFLNVYFRNGDKCSDAEHRMGEAEIESEETDLGR